MTRQLREIYQVLLNTYGPQGWWPIQGRYESKKPDERDKFEIVVGSILTQNTSWTQVEKALSNLGVFSKKDIEKLSDEELSLKIKPSGYFNQKTKKIRNIIAFLNSGKDVSRENLLDVWGVGPETVDSILLYAYGEPYFVIDAYTKRIFSRLGFEASNYNEWQSLFENNLEKDVGMYKEYHALIVELAKNHCKSKPVCEGCPLNKSCAYANS